MNKLSKFTYLIEDDNNYYVFNIVTSKIIALHPELYTLIRSNERDIDKLKDIHPDLFNALIKSEVIVNDSVDEARELIVRFSEFDRDLRTFGIIVNPTLDCNLRCWYCYESHKKGSMLGDMVLSSLKKLICRKLAIPGFRHLSVSFFGGEPLIGWDRVVIPLLEYSVEECEKRDISFSTGFTTNGVLLSEKKFKRLLELGLRDRASFQISFDGNRMFHDNSRVGVNKTPTYDTIMHNVRLGADMGFSMHLRFNYTPANLASFIDVLSELMEFPEESRKNIQCNFQQVWQTGDDEPGIKDRVLEIINQFRGEGIHIDSDIRFSRHLCYADTENNIVVNHDGLLFKCTAREFSKENSEGILLEDGTLRWNERYHQRMNIKYANEACIQCRIMPICNGGCSQNKLDRNDPSTCAYLYEDKDKEIKMLACFYNILNNLALSDKEIQSLLDKKKIRVVR